jgi:hypothetical protein
MSAQVNTTYFEAKDAFKSFPMLKQIPAEQEGIVLKEMQTVNVQQLLEEDKEMEALDVPFRFGYGIDVNYTLKDGVWNNLGAENVWSLRITSKGTFNLFFIYLKDNKISRCFSLMGYDLGLVQGYCLSTSVLPLSA